MASRAVAGLVLVLALVACGCTSTTVKFSATGPVLVPREGTVEVLAAEPPGSVVLGTLKAESQGPVSRASLIRRLQAATALHGGNAVVLTGEKSVRVGGLRNQFGGSLFAQHDSRTIDAVAVKQ